jgi:hypothetical protein
MVPIYFHVFRIAATTIVLTIMGLLSVGCASTDSIRQDSLSRGTSCEFATSSLLVASAARTSLMELDLEIVDDYLVDSNTTVLIAERGATAWSWGEVVRVAISSTAYNRTTVRIISRPRVLTNITAHDFTDDVISHMSAKIRP